MFGRELELARDVVAREGVDVVAAAARSGRMPEATNTCFTPGRARIFRSRSSCGAWSGFSAGQQEGKRQSRSAQAPADFLRGQSKPYMFAVGPPTSATVPRNFGCSAKRATSARIERALRLTTRRPWWTVIAQKRQFL